MASHGQIETEKLIENLEHQLDRLVTQLADLESCRDEVDAAEYQETKEDTIEQLKEFHQSLDKLTKGDISLVSRLGTIKLATQAAISQSFHTPEVIRLFSRHEPALLRDKLGQLEDNYKHKRVNATDHKRQKAEVLVALRALGQRLSAGELQFLEGNTDACAATHDVELVALNADGAEC